MVGLVFGWHEQNETPVNELHPTQGGEAHVHQDTVQDRHRNVLKAQSSWSKMETFPQMICFFAEKSSMYKNNLEK